LSEPENIGLVEDFAEKLLECIGLDLDSLFGKKAKQGLQVSRAFPKQGRALFSNVEQAFLNEGKQGKIP
jgi:hypothetical protein